MAGVASVATFSPARRRGYARALVTGLLDRVRDSGHAVSTLYPFRPLFYERLGFTSLLAVSPLGRALLLQFLARHIGQVTQAELWASPDELPELWATDLAAVTRAEISFPGAPAPMARVLSLPSLAGLRAGPLEVTEAGAASAEATLTAAGLSALAHGVLDPEDVVVRGLGDIGADPAARLRTLFPRQVPYLSARF